MLADRLNVLADRMDAAEAGVEMRVTRFEAMRLIISTQGEMSSILFGDTMVPIIQQDYILLWGYIILYTEYYLTRFNHRKNTTQMLNEARALLQQHGTFIVQLDPAWEVALRGSGTASGPARLDSSEHEGSGHP